jgi:HlyD family secretion protein
VIHHPTALRLLWPVPLLYLGLTCLSFDALAQDVSALGRVEPEHGVITVSAASTTHAVSGSVIRELLVDEGDWVEPGQLIAVTDSTEMLRHHQRMAERELELAVIAAEAASSQADEACTIARVAENEAARRASLLERGLASTEETEQAQGDSEARAASCTAGRANVRVASAAIEVARERVALRAAEVERSLVRAPSPGRVLAVHARPGELAGVAGVIDLGRTDRMLAVAEIYETDIGRVEVGMSASVSSEALSQNLTGRVERIRALVHKHDVIGTDPAARKDARIIEVEILLDDAKTVENLTNLQVEIIIDTDS